MRAEVRADYTEKITDGVFSFLRVYCDRVFLEFVCVCLRQSASRHAERVCVRLSTRG